MALLINKNEDFDIFLPQCLCMAWNMFMVFMVTSYFNYIDKNGPDILQKVPFYIPQKKEIDIGLKQPQAK